MKLKKYKDIYRLMYAEGLEALGEDGIECVVIKCPECGDVTETDYTDFPKEGTVVYMDCGCRDEIVVEYDDAL